MQFQVPQFIEVEDKIFGPLTFKQFIYVVGGGGAVYLLWRVLPIYLAAPLGAVIGALALALAFVQLNGRPFIVALEHGFFYVVRSKLYLWSKERERGGVMKGKPQAPSATPVYIPQISESKLHDLAWSLDIQERIQGGVATPEDRESYIKNISGGNIVAPVRTAREALNR